MLLIGKKKVSLNGFLDEAIGLRNPAEEPLSVKELYFQLAESPWPTTDSPAPVYWDEHALDMDQMEGVRAPSVYHIDVAIVQMV